MSTTMLRLLLGVCITGLVAVNGSVPQHSADANVNLAHKRLVNVQIEASGITALFSRLSLSHDIPIGLEVARHDDEWAIYRLDLRQGSLADLLTRFVTSHDQYDWKIENGVVYVFPMNKYRDAVLAELLAVEIGSFSVKEKTSCAGLGDALVATPEIRRIVETHRMKYRSQDISGFYIQQVGQNFSLTVSNMKLKAILDKVIRDSPVAKIWILQKDSSKETLLLRVNARFEEAPTDHGRADSRKAITEELPER